MFYGATPDVFEKARLLRSNETLAEKRLWERLYRNQLNGFRFKRQHPIAAYVADFYCHKALLVVEVDEAYHNKPKQRTLDQSRTEHILSIGLKVLTFSDKEVLSDIESVLSKIRTHLPTK